MAFEMLTGARPFDHESKVTLLGMHVTAAIPSMAERAPEAGIPPEVEAIVTKPPREGGRGALRRRAGAHRGARRGGACSSPRAGASPSRCRPSKLDGSPSRASIVDPNASGPRSTAVASAPTSGLAAAHGVGASGCLVVGATFGLKSACRRGCRRKARGRSRRRRSASCSSWRASSRSSWRRESRRAAAAASATASSSAGRRAAAASAGSRRSTRS